MNFENLQGMLNDIEPARKPSQKWAKVIDRGGHGYEKTECL
jgi:hypothetical protein